MDFNSTAFVSYLHHSMCIIIIILSYSINFVNPKAEFYTENPTPFKISCGGKASCRLAFTNIMGLRYLVSNLTVPYLKTGGISSTTNDIKKKSHEQGLITVKSIATHAN